MVEVSDCAILDRRHQQPIFADTPGAVVGIARGGWSLSLVYRLPPLQITSNAAKRDSPMLTASRSIPAALAMSEAALDVLRCPFDFPMEFVGELLRGPPVGGGDPLGGETTGVSIARSTSPATSGTSVVVIIEDRVCVAVIVAVDMVDKVGRCTGRRRSS